MRSATGPHAQGPRFVDDPPRRRKHLAYMRDYHLQKAYGLSTRQYNALLKAQRARCAICDKPVKRGRLSGVDHDHVTGAVRGILCTRCNVDLRAVENGDWLKRAFKYLGQSVLDLSR